MLNTRLFSFLTILILGLMLVQWQAATAETAAPNAVQATIGSGTAASCQTNSAINAFSSAVATGGVIDFNCGPDPVTININTSVTDQVVTVNGGGLVTLSGEDLRQIFLLTGSANLTLNDIVLLDGSSGQGGAIYIDTQASATINRSFITSSGSTGDGGGIYNRGTLTLNSSTLGSNIATVDGGGIFNNGGTVTINDSYLVSNQSQNGGAVYTVNGQLTMARTAVRSSYISNMGGGIFAAGTTQISNSTFSNNRALKGGALFAIANVTILNATFNENRADLGGAIWREPSSTTTVKNSILAGSRDANNSGPSLNCDGMALTSLGRNIISDNTCVPNPSVVGDLHSTDPQLGLWLGSVLHGYIPADTSPAVDYGQDCPAVDQRSYPRPLGAACDVGSIERGALLFVPLVIR